MNKAQSLLVGWAREPNGRSGTLFLFRSTSKTTVLAILVRVVLVALLLLLLSSASAAVSFNPRRKALRRVGAQREADHDDCGRGPGGHHLDRMIRFRERGVQEHGTHLGPEIEDAKTFEAVRKGLVGGFGEKLATLHSFLEIVRGNRGQERPGRERARESTPRPRGNHRKRVGAQLQARKEQKGRGQQRVFDVDGVVTVGGRQAHERLGDAVGHTAGPREGVLAHVLGEGARPDGSAQGGGGSIAANQGSAHRATVGLVRDQRGSPGNSSEDWGKAGPKGASNASRDEGEVEPPAGWRTQLLPRVLGGGTERGKARHDDWRRRERSDPREEAVLKGGHHRPNRLV